MSMFHLTDEQEEALNRWLGEEGRLLPEQPIDDHPFDVFNEVATVNETITALETQVDAWNGVIDSPFRAAVVTSIVLLKAYLDELEA